MVFKNVVLTKTCLLEVLSDYKSKTYAIILGPLNLILISLSLINALEKIVPIKSLTTNPRTIVF